MFFQNHFISGCRLVNIGPLLENMWSLERYCGALFTSGTTDNPINAGMVFSAHARQVMVNIPDFQFEMCVRKGLFFREC